MTNKGKNKKFDNHMNPTENKKTQETVDTEKTTSNEQVSNEAKEQVDSQEANTDKKIKEEAAQELTAEEKLTNELEDAKKQIEDQHDKYLRLSAEFDNYRKRTLKEKAEIIKNGAEKTIDAILPVLDDFERALDSIKPTEDAKAIHDGIELIYNKFVKTLHQLGLEKIETKDKDFDTDYHEAIALVPAPSEDKKGKILDCVQPGYKLNDKVIRHSKVVVAQ